MTKKKTPKIKILQKKGKKRKKEKKKKPIQPKKTKKQHAKKTILTITKDKKIKPLLTKKPTLGIKINLQDSKSKKPLKRVATGIKGFDKMIEGGFEGNSINLITGGIGSGKTVFAMEFLVEGMKKGEKTLYVNFEEKKEEFVSNMKTFGWDVEKYEREGKFIFLEYSPEKVKMMLDEGGGAIESVIFKNDIKRLVIDSISSFTLLFTDDLSKRQAILGLFDIMRKWNCTMLLTVQENPGIRRGRRVHSVELEADSITLNYFVSINGVRERFVEVIKMRGTNHSKEIHEFRIDKTGITIGKKANIKELEKAM